MRLSALFLVLMTSPFLDVANAVERSPVLEPTSDPGESSGATKPGGDPAHRAASNDTTWIADWSFDAVTECNESGWSHGDNRILNDGSNWWSVDARFAGSGSIVGNAAVLSRHDLGWARDGYGNDWDYAIILKYQGTATLAFAFLSDSESGYDFVSIEADSLGASESRVDYSLDPSATPAAFRQVLLTLDGLQSGTIGPLALPDFGDPQGIHEVYLRFHSDSGFSDEDGKYASFWNAGLVVDDIAVTGGVAYTEDFEGTLNPSVLLANTAPSSPFGDWARLFVHPTDNDPCGENRTCAWIFTDPELSALTPGMSFGPEGTVVRNWLDNTIVSPWVSLAGTQGTTGTFLTFRLYPGNNYSTSRIVLGTSIRSLVRVDDTDTPTSGDSIEVVMPWQLNSLNSLSTFQWQTRTHLLTTVLAPGAVAVQVRFRVSDYQYILGAGPPVPLDPGPGPYLDRIRLGRLIPGGPTFTFEIMGVAQDNFASELTSTQPVEDYTPSTDRFGVSDFSPPWRHLGANLGMVTYFKTRDSLWVEVKDLRGAGGVTSIQWSGAIVAGPHAGKAPPPWTVGANGFFQIPADSVRNSSGEAAADRYFIDLDDRYFRGGDAVHFFWSATDASGGYSSYPAGLVSEPNSYAEAVGQTGGLLEVSFLPAIDWDPAYLARIAADPHGKLEPTAQELAGSRQRNCILYSAFSPSARPAGDIHRTAFMYTLDALGYRDAYDVYDHNTGGSATTNNPLASRASVEQATAYSLIVVDAPGGSYSAIPEGTASGVENIVLQSQWFQDWLAHAATSAAGRASLWVILNGARGFSPTHVVSSEMATEIIDEFVDVGVHPLVVGESGFTWADGSSHDFGSDQFVLAGSQCLINHYSSILAATSDGVATHRLASFSTPLSDAVIMNTDPLAAWNTVFMGLQWAELVNADGTPQARVLEFADVILRAALADSCERSPDPATDRAEPAADLEGLRQTTLYASIPNPFNPTTTIRFDLAQDAHVELRIYDVAGRLVRTLVNQSMQRDHHAIVWDGLDDAGVPVSSGIYFYRLETGAFIDSRKMVVLR